jgi:hypothetical protein
MESWSMTFTDDEPLSQSDQPGSSVPVEPPPAVAGDGDHVNRVRRVARSVHRVLRPLTAYPRVTIEAVLMAASLVVGLVILPSLAAATPGNAAISEIILERPANIPSYLLFDDFGTGLTVALGMDVPKGKKAPWKLLIAYDSQDQLTNESMSRPVSPGGSAGSVGAGYKSAVFTGTMAGGSNSYTEFDNGYYTVFSQRYNAFSNSSGLPSDYEVVNFNISGPVQVDTVSGANLAASLPALLHVDDSTGKGQTTAPFNSEVFYDGGSYEAVTGGATIEGGQYWDWFDHGIFPPTVATGVDVVKQQAEQNDTFIAAAMFGLSAAAAAALCVELVEAYQDHRRRLRGAG